MWFKLCDQGTFHEKVLAAGNAAYGAWCRAGQWSSWKGTDGVIPLRVAHLIAAPPVWAQLESVGLCDAPIEGGYVIHNFLKYNPTAAEVAEKREASRAQRSAAGKNSAARRTALATRTTSVASSLNESLNESFNESFNETATVAQRASNPDPDPDPVPVCSANKREKELRSIGPEIPDAMGAKLKGRKPSLASTAPPGFAEVMATYQRVFVETHRGAKPVISARTGKAAKTLLGLMPLADVVRTIESAFADDWFVKSSSELDAIAARPNRWRGADAGPDFTPPSRPRPPPQTPEEREQITRDLAAFDEAIRNRSAHA